MSTLIRYTEKLEVKYYYYIPLETGSMLFYLTKGHHGCLWQSGILGILTGAVNIYYKVT